MIVQSVFARQEYVPKQDRNLPEDQQTVFVFRSPTLDERLTQEDTEEIEVFGNPENMANVKTKIKTGKESKKQVALAKACLVEIRNLKDEQGNEVLWGKKTPKDQVLAMIFPVIPELYRAILDKSKVSEEEEKNSDSV